MYQTLTIKLKDHPEAKRLILAVDPTYKKHDAYITVQDTPVELYGTYWSGGTINTYTAVNIATRHTSAAPQYDPPQFGGPKETPKVALPEGVAIVKTGMFCGKKACARIYLHPANAAKLLPAPQAT